MNSAPGPRLKIVRLTPVKLIPTIKRVSTIATSPSVGNSSTCSSNIDDDITSINTITDLVEVGREIVVNSLEKSPTLLSKELLSRCTYSKKPPTKKVRPGKVNLPKSLRSKTVASILYPTAKSQRDADTFLSQQQHHQQKFSDQQQQQQQGADTKGSAKMSSSSSSSSTGNRRVQFCRLCDRLFKSHESYVKHFIRDHPGVTREQDMFDDPWRCMYCGDWFDGPRRLSYHVKSYHKDALVVKEAVVETRPTLAECKLCGAVLKSSLVKHTLKAHPDELDRRARDIVKDPRQCPLCGKLCSGEQGLRNHLYRTHGSSVARGLMKQGSVYMDLRNPDPMPVSSQTVKRAAAADPLLADDATADQQPGPVAKRMSTTPIILDNDFDSFQIAEETVANDVLQDNLIGNDSDDEECSPSFCRICRVDLMNTTHLASHIELNHKQVTCPLCVPLVICEGLLGLDSHDDSFHAGAIRLQSATHLP